MAAEEKSGIGGQILVGVMVALLVGGSAPWWWGEVTGGGEGPEPSEPGGQMHHGDGPVRMEIRCSANPHMIPSGGDSELVVQAIGSDNSPVAGAKVRISTGGGVFPASGSRTFLGETDAGGALRTMWRAPHEAANSYGMEVTVSHPGGGEEHTACEVMIRR